MITYTTNLDNEAYAKLFEEIAELGGPKIENLEQFFGNIQEIAQLDPKFLRLPLDEPMLEINANTRKINIDSTDFKANGISVQGDHLAETVFFKIDRYFDFMDLMNTEIYINWKIGSESGRDKCFIKSDSIIPGCIVFGWSISNHITGKSGSLSFAVELEIMHDDGQKYSLNTLAATAAIKDGLVLIDPELYDMSDNVLAILSNSQFGEGSAAVDAVSWVSGGGNGLVADLNEEFSPVINLVPKFSAEDGLSSDPVVMYALATAGRDASILYSDKNKGTNVVVSYIDAPAGALKDDVVYYVAEDSVDAVPAYRIADEDERAAWGTDDEVPLFVEVIEVVVDNVGEYYIHAQGVKYDEAGNKIGASAVTASTPITVPSAEVPKNVAVSAVERPEVEGYTFDDSAANTIYLTSADEAVTIEATAEFEKEGDFGLLAFAWYKDGEAISDADLVYSAENKSTYAVAAPGEYYAKAYHYRNKETKEKDSDVRLVSNLASKMAIEAPERVTIKANRDGAIAIDYTLDDATRAYATPKFDCELQLLAEDEEGNIVAGGEQVIPVKEVIVGADTITCKVASTAITNDGGLYRVKVSHSYNGSIYSDYTNNFAINIS